MTKWEKRYCKLLDGHLHLSPKKDSFKVSDFIPLAGVVQLHKDDSTDTDFSLVLLPEPSSSSFSSPSSSSSSTISRVVGKKELDPKTEHIHFRAADSGERDGWLTALRAYIDLRREGAAITLSEGVLSSRNDVDGSGEPPLAVAPGRKRAVAISPSIEALPFDQDKPTTMKSSVTEECFKRTMEPKPSEVAKETVEHKHDTDSSVVTNDDSHTTASNDRSPRLRTMVLDTDVSALLEDAEHSEIRDAEAAPPTSPQNTESNILRTPTEVNNEGPRRTRAESLATQRKAGDNGPTFDEVVSDIDQWVRDEKARLVDLSSLNRASVTEGKTASSKTDEDICTPAEIVTQQAGGDENVVASSRAGSRELSGTTTIAKLELTSQPTRRETSPCSAHNSGAAPAPAIDSKHNRAELQLGRIQIAWRSGQITLPLLWLFGAITSAALLGFVAGSLYF